MTVTKSFTVTYCLVAFVRSIWFSLCMRVVCVRVFFSHSPHWLLLLLSFNESRCQFSNIEHNNTTQRERDKKTTTAATTTYGAHDKRRHHVYCEFTSDYNHKLCCWDITTAVRVAYTHLISHCWRLYVVYLVVVWIICLGSSVLCVSCVWCRKHENFQLLFTLWLSVSRSLFPFLFVLSLRFVCLYWFSSFFFIYF